MFPANEKSEKFKYGRQKKWYSLDNSTECKGSSTVVGSRNSRTHEIFIVDSTTVDGKSCCCSNGKIAKKSNESKVEYSPPPGIGFSFACCHLPLSHQADGFQMLVDSGS